jgi:hypothetical protein
MCAYLATSSPRATATACPLGHPLFTACPLNPNPPGHVPSGAHIILYPVATSVGSMQQCRIPPMAVGCPHVHAVAVPISQLQQPLVNLQPRSYAAVPWALVKGLAVRRKQPPRGVCIAQQPKVSDY